MPSPRRLAVILSGGLSRRMGADKVGVRLGGRPLLAHVIERLTPQVDAMALNAPQSPTGFEALTLVPDTLPDRLGPLAGVLAALRHAQDLGITRVLTVSIDSPFLPGDLADRLAARAEDSLAIAVAASGGRSHPVIGSWPARLADELEAWLADPAHRRVTDFLARHAVDVVEFAPLVLGAHAVDPFFNINTAEDLRLAETFLQEPEP